MKTLIVTPKKAYKHFKKVKIEMEQILADKKAHEERKAQPAQLSLVDHMNATGLLSHWHSRKALAEKYGITDYAGTSGQNARLLGILQANGNNRPDTNKQ